MSTFLDTLADIENRYDELEQLMADPTVTADHLRLQEIGRERAELDVGRRQAGGRYRRGDRGD